LNGVPGLVLDKSIVAPPDSLPPGPDPFSEVDARTIDELCPYTSWTVRDSITGANIQYTLPKFLVLTDLFEKGIDPVAAGDLVINVNDGPGPQGPHTVYLGFAIACSNLVVRPAFLAPNPPPFVDEKGQRAIRTYEQDLDYFCLYFAPTISVAPEWFCATGNLADGVTGIAAKQAASNPSAGPSSPATFFFNQIQWGPNTWSKHWEFPHGLGAVVSRIPGLAQTGFAKDYQWNLNPNDSHADGRSKASDYIAAVGVKTATNRNGVNISPYNTHHVIDFFNVNPTSAPLDTLAYAGLVDPGELNQSEVERRSCGTGDPSLCFGYFSKPDVASTGTTGHSGYGVVDITVGPYYGNNPDTCSWSRDWGFSGFDVFQGGSVRPPPPIGGSSPGFLDNYPVALANSAFTVAVNLGDNEIARCPSWSVCQTSGSQPTVHLYGEDE